VGRISVYTAKQWDWIAARYMEGYTYRELADFTGLCLQSIAQKLCSMGANRHPERLPLESRKAEFNALCGEVIV